MPNRAAAEQFILKYIGKITPGSDNVKLYEDLFKGMSDKRFDEFMEGLNTYTTILAIIVPHGSEGLNVDRNIKVGKELGISFFKKLWLPDGEDGEMYLTPFESMVIDIPLRRASQLLTKKLSVAEGKNTFDALTGQTVDQGAALSYPEVQMLAAMGLDATLTELLKYRGGDRGGMAAMDTLLAGQGTVSLNTLKDYATGVESVATLKTFLNCMHLQNTL